LKLERSKTKIIVEDVFGGMSENISRYYPDLSGADREALKQYLFAFYLTDPKVWEDITWAMSEDEFKALTAWQENKNSVTAASLKKFEEARQVEFFTKLPEMRSKAVTLPQKWRLYEDLKWARDSFFLDELKVSFHEKMLPEERLGMDAVSQLKASADSEFGSALNARSDLKTVLSFRVCNKRLQPLLSYSFYVSGFMKNRSTAQAVRATDRDALQTEFTGDIIVGPNACSGFEWTGPYKFFDRYKITDVQGNWQ
jgi:hypothetical protein